MDIFGYFDAPDQQIPAHDPGMDAPCPICTEPLSNAPRVTISLMKPGDKRSYFFRVHKACWAAAPDDERQHIESLLIDERLNQ